MTTETTALTVVQRAVVALGYDEETRKGLTALAGETKHITAITNADGREQTHAALMKLKNTRIEIEKRGKAAREDAQKFSKAVISEEDSLIGIISPEEDRLQELRDEWDGRIERERQAEVEAEQKRQAEIEGRIQNMRNAVNSALRCKTSAELVRILADVQGTVIDDELFATYKDTAQLVKSGAVAEIERIRDEFVKRETEAEQLRKDRAELDRQRAEQAQNDRKAAEARAAADRLAAEMNERLAELRGNPNLTASMGSTLIAEHLHDLDKLPTDGAIFGPFVQQAVDAKASGVARLETLLKAAQEYEREQERQAQQRKENERVAAEQRAAQEVIDKANRELEARQQAERDAQAKKEREELEAREAAEQAERDRVAAVEREAENQRLANWRPTFDEIVATLADNYSRDEATVRTWIAEPKAKANRQAAA